MGSPDKQRRILGFLFQGVIALGIGTIAALVVYLPPAGWTTNDVTTGKHPGYPDIVTHHYDMSVDHTTTFAAEAIRRIPGGHVKSLDAVHGQVTGEATVLGTPFIDDVTITVTPEGSHSAVEIRSHSRVGKGDLGVNATRIRAIQALMDDKLPRI